MTQTRFCMLVALLSLALVGSEGQAATKKKTKTHSSKTVSSTMVWKHWSLTDLVDPAARPEETELFVKFVMKAVRPTSWKGHGGHGLVRYQSQSKSLVVHQTPAVQKQVGCLLKAMVMLKSGAEKQVERQAVSEAVSAIGAIMPAAYPPAPPPLACPAPRASSAKQYGHFVIDDVKVNAMGVSATIKKIKFMYKGDGIEGDVAKCALSNGDSERKGDLDKLIEQVSKLVDLKQDTKKEKAEGYAEPCYLPHPCCVPPPCCVPVCVPTPATWGAPPACLPVPMPPSFPHCPPCATLPPTKCNAVEPKPALERVKCVEVKDEPYDF